MQISFWLWNSGPVLYTFRNPAAYICFVEKAYNHATLDVSWEMSQKHGVQWLFLCAILSLYN